jgi:hypothetical protein
VAELALDDVDGHALAREFDGVGMAELMGSEPAPNPRFGGELAQFGAGGGGGPSPPAGGAVDHTEQRADRQGDAVGQPGSELLEAERVHPGFTTLVAFAVSDEQRPPAFVDVSLGQSERLGDPQTGAPQDRDQGPQAQPVAS